MAEEPPKVFTVRGRPVGFQSSRYGGALVALERGYFPVSASGYLSLASEFWRVQSDCSAAICADLLDALAAAQDKERRAILTRVRRAPRLGSDRLGNFIGVSIDVEKAVHDGFFAPNADREELWRAAFRLLCMIDADPRFQPEPSAPAWTPAHCVAALEEKRKLLNVVRCLARGEYPAERPPFNFLPLGYFNLPVKPGGEPCFPLPEAPLTLGLEIPEGQAPEDENMDEDTELPAASAQKTNSAGHTQLSLF